MALSVPLRNTAFTTSVHRVPSLALNDVRQIATLDPEYLPDAAAYARRFYVRSGLARAA